MTLKAQFAIFFNDIFWDILNIHLNIIVLIFYFYFYYIYIYIYIYIYNSKNIFKIKQWFKAAHVAPNSMVGPISFILAKFIMAEFYVDVSTHLTTIIPSHTIITTTPIPQDPKRNPLNPQEVLQ